MFRFCFPYQDGSVFNVAVGGNDIHQSFDEFKRYYSHVEIPGAIAVYHNSDLIARVLSTYNAVTERLEPLLEVFPL